MLLPLIAGVLLLLYAGSTLTEMFSAQRMRAVHKVQSAQAFWTAEAGAWHSAQLGTSIETPVAFADGSYAVARAGDTYTALATRDGVRRLVTVELTRSEEVVGGEEDEEEGGGGDDLIDNDASAATAEDYSDDTMRLDLVSVSDEDLEIASFELSATGDDDLPQLKEFKLDGDKILNNARLSLPTGDTDLNHGSSSDRTIDALDDPDLKIKFRDEVDAGDYQVTLVLHFTDGSSDTVVFDVEFP